MIGCNTINPQGDSIPKPNCPSFQVIVKEKSLLFLGNRLLIICISTTYSFQRVDKYTLDFYRQTHHRYG